MVKRRPPASSGSTRRSSKSSKKRGSAASAKAATSKKKPARDAAAKKAPGKKRAAKKPAAKKIAAKRVITKKAAPKTTAAKRVVVKQRVKRPIVKSQASDRATSSRSSLQSGRIDKAANSVTPAQAGMLKNGARATSIGAKRPATAQGVVLPIGVGSRVAASAKKAPIKASRSAARQALGMPERLGPGGKARRQANGRSAFPDGDSEELSKEALDRSVRIALDGMLACLGAETPADPPATSADLASARIWRWLKRHASFEDGTEMAPEILDGALSKAAADPYVESRGGLTATVLPPAIDLLRDLCLSDTFEDFSLLVARLRNE